MESVGMRFTTETGWIKTSRFDAQVNESDPLTAGVVVYEFGDLGGQAFGEVFSRLTARGELTSIGHGSSGSIRLDGDDHYYSGFCVSDILGGDDGDPYGLPNLGLHGVRVWLKHCESGYATTGSDMITQMLRVLRNNGDGVGDGIVTGYTGAFDVRYFGDCAEKYAVTPSARIGIYDTLFGGMTTNALADGISAPTELVEKLRGTTTTPIEAGAVEIRCRAALGFDAAGRNIAVKDGETIAYNSLVYEGGLFVFKGCTGVQAHDNPAPGQREWITLVHPDRGDWPWYARWALQKFEFEDCYEQGLVERFNDEVLSTIDIGGGKKANEFIHFGMSYSGRPDKATGSAEVSVP
jgi:hypothetical protein